MSDQPPPPRVSREMFERTEETPRAYERAPGTGVYRRRIHVRATRDYSGTGELEDDFHHFRVDMGHDGSAVTEIVGSGIRSPWTMCLSAGDPLQMVIGTALATGPATLGALDAKANCTHMFDLAGLLVNQAARGVGERVYDMEVDDPDPGPGPGAGDQHCRLWRDGELLYDWHICGATVLGPPEWIDAPLWQGFIGWAGANLDDDAAEAAVALRRVIAISRGRFGDLDEMETAQPLMDRLSGICHAFQPAHAPLAIRHRGSARDFTDHPELLLADFDDRRRRR